MALGRRAILTGLCGEKAPVRASLRAPLGSALTDFATFGMFYMQI
jgi:hypothetical protein